VTPVPAKVRTCLWFDGAAEDAARFYVTLIPDSRIDATLRPDANGPALIIDFTLGGTAFQALNGGPQYTLNEAASISVLTEDQAETDRLWNALIADGGQESRCAWLKDRFGVSWQIVPKALPRCLADPDRAAAMRAMQAMLTMSKIDVAKLEAAFSAQ
jgi:predicted 3-demethylubiquinone-9 3-methyltransferase (glyoxalase superfamily)